jgi:hypothetical protein
MRGRVGAPIRVRRQAARPAPGGFFFFFFFFFF